MLIFSGGFVDLLSGRQKVLIGWICIKIVYSYEDRYLVENSDTK